MFLSFSSDSLTSSILQRQRLLLNEILQRLIWNLLLFINRCILQPIKRIGEHKKLTAERILENSSSLVLSQFDRPNNIIRDKINDPLTVQLEKKSFSL